MLVPGVVAGWIPWTLRGGAPAPGGVWNGGWMLVAAGVLIYLHCLLRFLLAKGTPNIFFASHLRWLIGNEPAKLVSGGLYRFSRNPMYLGVLTAIFGQAIVFRSMPVAIYGATMLAVFHVVVIALEEPHLRAREGAQYARYCQEVPRWLW